jgi:hypothetical protein
MFMELANGVSMDVAQAETSSFIHKHSNLLDHQVSSIFAKIGEIPQRSDINLQIRPDTENSFKACVCYRSNVIFETSLTEDQIKYPAGDLFNLLLRYGSLSPDTNFFWSIPAPIYSLIENVFAFDPLANFNSSLLGNLSSRQSSPSLNIRRSSDSSIHKNSQENCPNSNSNRSSSIASQSCVHIDNCFRRSSDSTFSIPNNGAEEWQTLRNYLIIEGFASPFNHNIEDYCSLFPEDKTCGSLGNFFSVIKTHKPVKPTVWICNPPFVLRIIDKMEEAARNRLEFYLDDIFFFMLPSWSGVSIYQYLEENGVLAELEPEKYAVYDHSHAKYVHPPLNMKFGAVAGNNVDIRIVQSMMDSILTRFANLAKIRKGRGRRRRRKRKTDNENFLSENPEQEESLRMSLPKISPRCSSYEPCNSYQALSPRSDSSSDAESETLSDTSEGISTVSACDD